MDGTKGGGVFPVESGANGYSVDYERDDKDYSAAEQIPFHTNMFGKRAKELNRLPRGAMRFRLAPGEDKKRGLK